MKKMLLFQWMGIAPRWARSASGTHIQVSCAVACPSKAAFKRLTDTPESRMPWISVMPLDGERVPSNEGARLAVENPGVVYFHDTLRQAPKDAEWFVHSQPEQA